MMDDRIIAAQEKLSREMLYIQNQMRRYGRLHEDTNRLLSEIEKVLVDQSKISEKLLFLEQQIERKRSTYEARFYKIEKKLEANNKILLTYSGGIAALLSLAGLFGIFGQFIL